MLPLLKVFWEIVRLRQGPQVLPASNLLLGIVLGLHFLLGLIVLSLSLAFGSALIDALVGTALLVALIHLFLLVRGLSHRFTQTAIALGGAEFLLTLAIFPFSAWFVHGGNVVITSVVSLLVLGWSLVVTGHIFRHALQVQPWTGFAVAFLYMVISYAVAGLFAGSGA